jgi:hypothetical protein
MRKHGTLAAVALLAVALGCAEQRPPINRVQANALSKSFFVGPLLHDISDDPEFFFRTQVVDVGYGAAQDGLFTSSWGQANVSRIKWEITEEYLNGRLAYERINDTDSKGNPIDGLSGARKTTNDGQIVCSFRISSHFDIKRSYNPTTGEPLNVIEENQSDRPWYDREYFRVDWGANHATDAYQFDTLSLIGVYGSVDYEPLGYYVADPNDPDAPHFATEEGYFDITTKAFAKPKQIDLSSLGWGIDRFPACMLPGEFAGGTQPYGNCNPVELTLRHSFRQVVDNDFEPALSDGLRFQAFGHWAVSNVRMGYERNYGMVDDKWLRLISRYNIWERSHYYADPVAMTGEIPCATHDTTVVPTGDPNADANRDVLPKDGRGPGQDGNGTADECEEVTARTQLAGSQCDIVKGRCTLPYVARTTKTIPWYVTGNVDEDLFEASLWGTQEWDLSIKAAVQTARLVECRKTATDCDSFFPMFQGQMDDYKDAVDVAREHEMCQRSKGWDNPECERLVDTLVDGLAGERGGMDINLTAIQKIVKAPHILVLCHNPVTSADHPSCGQVGLAPRFGDLRYNHVNHIATPQTPSAWGIYMDSEDPLSGEKVSASINIWTHITDIYAQQAMDLVRYINGELKTTDITNGDYVRQWVQAQKVSAGGMGTPTLSQQQVTERLAAVTKLSPQQFGQVAKTRLSPELKAVLGKLQQQVSDVALSADVASPARAAVYARMNQARGTPVEAALMNPAMLQLAGFNGDAPLAGSALDHASPLALNNPKVRSQIKQMKQLGLAKRGSCVIMEEEAPEPSGLTGLADIMARKFPKVDGESGEQRDARWSAMMRYLRRRYHYAVIGHEMGHSVGLRHNFVSSSGPLFYRPQYWQLRTRNGSVTTECNQGVSDGTNCIGPRYYDPVTEEERSGMIWMFMNSTIMDYAGDITQDMIGLGVTDFATVRSIYGDTVAYYSSPAIQADTDIGGGLSAATDTFGGLAGIRYYPDASGQTTIHYSQLQNYYAVINKCYTTTPVPPTWWNPEKDGTWDPTLDGMTVSVDGEYKKCRQMPVDYASWNDLTGEQVAGVGSGFVRSRGGNIITLADGSTRLRVPYHFASDNWADVGNVSVFRHDNGADPYEQIQWEINTQENRHILDNYRRNRTTFDIRAAADRSYSRYNEKILKMSAGAAFMSRIYENQSAGSGITFESLFPYAVNSFLRENVIGASVGFDHLARNLTRPEQGDHYELSAEWEDPVWQSMNDPDAGLVLLTAGLTIPNGTTGYFRDVGFGGHPIENALDESKGEYAVDYQYNAGSYYDKVNSIIHLSMCEDRFISQSRGDFYDARFRANGLPDLFPDGYRRLVANALAGDRSILAPSVAGTLSGSTCRPRLDNGCDSSRDPLCKTYPAQPMGWTSLWPKAGPIRCFSKDGSLVCDDFQNSANYNPDMPECVVPVDPQVGWESQKFVIAWVLSHLSETWNSSWIDMMKIYRLGPEVTPAFENRIEWQDPISGDVYYARTYGKECLFGTGDSCTGGKIVQKGIAARVLEWANFLTGKGFMLDPTKVLDGQACDGGGAGGPYPAGYTKFGRPCVKRQPSGDPIVTPDPAITTIMGSQLKACDQNDPLTPNCTPLTVNDNHWAYVLRSYKSVPDYLWESLVAFGWGDPHELGLYP